MCEFCLKYFKSYVELIAHKTSDDPCNFRRGPPGTLIYKDNNPEVASGIVYDKKDPRNVDSVSVFMVEGASQPLYC